MAAAIGTTLDESFKCIICLDYPNDAVELSCCQQISCESCLKSLENSRCPNCRTEDITYAPIAFLRKMIGNIPVKCDICQETTTRSELEKHQEICPMNLHECPIEGCDQQIVKSNLAIHFAELHSSLVTSSVQAMCAEITRCSFPNCEFKGPKNKVYKHLISSHENEMMKLVDSRLPCPIPRCQLKKRRQQMINHIITCHEKHLIGRLKHACYVSKQEPMQMKNGKGENVSMSENGKFYCGRKNSVYVVRQRSSDTALNDESIQHHDLTGTCNKIGINCQECMTLDVIFRNLPFGSLVNDNGNVCRPKPCTHDLKNRGNFYQAINSKFVLCHATSCGQKPDYCCEQKQGIDGAICQYDNQCPSCEKITELMSNPKREETYLCIWK